MINKKNLKYKLILLKNLFFYKRFILKNNNYINLN